MVAKKPSARKPRSLSKAQDEEPIPEFILSEYNVIKLDVERFLPNQLAAKGTYSIKTDIGEISLPEEGDSPFGTVEYTVVLKGHRKSEDGQSEPVKSFGATVKLEGRFHVYDCVITENDVETVDRLLPPVIQQLHSICVEKIRTFVADLGYRGVRPDLGLRRLRTSTQSARKQPV